MIARNLRWGESAGGMACGPVSGSRYVELAVTCEKGCFFILISTFESFEKIEVCTVPVFDLAMLMDAPDVDFSQELKKIEDHTAESYLTEMSKPDELEALREKLERSEFGSAVKLARMAMVHYMDAEETPGTEEAEKFLELYRGKDPGSFHLPMAVSEGYSWYYLSAEEREKRIRRQLRTRLTLETDISHDSVFHVAEPDALEMEKRELQQLRLQGPDDTVYAAWRDSFLQRELENLRGRRFVTCRYVFIGTGEYEDTLPEEELPAFREWVNGNSSAFLAEERPATDEEICRYIALNAANDAPEA